jgi:hypothetical protein
MINKNIYFILLNKKFVSLSEDIIYLILEFSDKIRYRNSKYIGRIENYDIRYNILKQIRQPIFYTKNYFKLIFYYKDKISGFMFQYYYDVNTNSLYIDKTYFIKKNITNEFMLYNHNKNKYPDNYTPSINYILNANGSWSIIKNYSM